MSHIPVYLDQDNVHLSFYYIKRGAWSGVVVKALVGRYRDRFPVVSLDFSVTYLLPTVPWPWGRLSP